MNVKDLKKQASKLKPQFNVGKSGVTEGVIETVDKFLEARGMAKIKVLAGEKEAVRKIGDEIAKRTKSEVVDRKGFTFVLFRD